MKAYRSAFYGSLLAFAFPLLIHADEASKAAKIEEMLMLTHADKIVDQMIAQMQPIMAAQMKKNLPDETRAAADEMQKKVMQWMSEKLSWQKMKPVYVKIYADTLTEEEIAGAVEFYKTPAGQALLNKMPILMQKSMTYVQEMMGDIIPEIQKMVSEEIEKKSKN